MSDHMTIGAVVDSIKATHTPDLDAILSTISDVESRITETSDARAVVLEKFAIPFEPLMAEVRRGAEVIVQAGPEAPEMTKFNDLQSQTVLLMAGFVHGFAEGRAARRGTSVQIELFKNSETPDTAAVTRALFSDIDENAVHEMAKATALKQVAMMLAWTANGRKIDMVNGPMSAQVFIGYLAGWDFDSVRRLHQVVGNG